MGGDLIVASAVGVGSDFTLRLALEQVGATWVPEAASEPATLEEGVGLRVLAAEDNQVNRLVLKTLLAQLGIVPVVVENGAEAVDAWRDGVWDVILMDIQMPVMDGISACRAIRAAEREENRPRTPIVALTANAMTHQVAEYATAGMDAHVAKPIEVMRLYEVLAQLAGSEEEEAVAA